MSVITTAPPTRSQVILALLSVYFIWGSTYLFIHFMTETMPPLLMSGIRNTFAGGVLYLFARFRAGGSLPTVSNWKAAALLGFLLLAVANGGMAVALRLIPSGIGTLLVAMLPVWIVLLNWFGFSRQRPSLPVAAGLVLGLAGFVILTGGPQPPPDLPQGGGVVSSPPLGGGAGGGASLNWIGVGIIVVGVISWGIGTLLAPRLPLHPSQLQATSMQMLSGGVILLVSSLVYEHPSPDVFDQLTPKAGWSLVYLIVFGSWMGFTAYAWLAQNAPPHITATYAYVNPVVAMFLGWLFAGEKLTGQSLLAAAVILAGVVLITSQKKLKRRAVNKMDA
mgnify:CR=1 FL=1